VRIDPSDHFEWPYPTMSDGQDCLGSFSAKIDNQSAFSDLKREYACVAEIPRTEDIIIDALRNRASQ
jgi:hypothetical protein